MKKIIYLLRYYKATGQEPDAELIRKGKEQVKENGHFFEEHCIKHIIPAPSL